jgi:hypothetical protein
MNLHFMHHPVINQKDEPGKHIQLPFYEPQHNTNEGSEFLDDAIRMKDQPLMYTEESVAPASPI